MENIDTRNNVLVRDDTEGHSRQNNSPPEKDQSDNPDKKFAATVPYVTNSIEALAVSGVFEEEPREIPQASHKIGVYDNNQAIIKDEELDRTGRNYLKHFYEKNEHLIEVDELI